MRIAQIAPIWASCPPKKYGGIEYIVSLLTEELVSRGHSVTLFATGNSVTKAELRSVYDRPPLELMGNPIPGLLHAQFAFQGAEFATPRFDIIHNHIGLLGTVLSTFTKTPNLHTLHGIFPSEMKRLYLMNKEKFYNSISNNQRLGCPELNYIGTVYNAIEVEKFEFEEEKDDYFVFVSRFNPEKGVHIAIEVARKAGVKLKISGKIESSDKPYYESKIRPFVDGKQIIEIPEMTFKEKVDLLKKAKAFIFPLQWSEPFGLVMPEAMVCGTPVVAFGYGSVPEVVKDRETGWIVDTVDEMVEVVKTIDSMPQEERSRLAKACRRHVEENFSVARMTSSYEALYKKIVRGQTPT